MNLKSTLAQLQENQVRIMGKISFMETPSTTQQQTPMVAPIISNPPMTFQSSQNNGNIDSNTVATDRNETFNFSPQPGQEGEVEGDMSVLVERVAEELIKYLKKKDKMQCFEEVLEMLCGERSRASCCLRLLSYFFKEEEMSSTWYGNTSEQPRKPLDRKRVSIVKELTMIRFPLQHGEVRRPILMDLNARIRNRCRFTRSKLEKRIKKEIT